MTECDIALKVLEMKKGIEVIGSEIMACPFGSSGGGTEKVACRRCVVEEVKSFE